jgi:hypothetical protein
MTHVFMFSTGFVPCLFKSIASAFNRSSTTEYLVCSCKEKDAIMYGFEVKLITEQVLLIAGSGQQIKMFFYKRDRTKHQPDGSRLVALQTRPDILSDPVLVDACSRSLLSAGDNLRETRMSIASRDLVHYHEPASEFLEDDLVTSAKNSMVAKKFTEELSLISETGHVIIGDSYNTTLSTVLAYEPNFESMCGGGEVCSEAMDIILQNGVGRIAASINMQTHEANKHRVMVQEHFILRLNKVLWNEEDVLNGNGIKLCINYGKSPFFGCKYLFLVGNKIYNIFF